MADLLLAAVNARIRRFTESGDASALLEPAAIREASQLFDGALPAGGDPGAVPVDVLTALAYLHWCRYRVLPEGQDQNDLRLALDFFAALLGRAPERIPGEIRGQIAAAVAAGAAGAAGHARSLTAEGLRAFSEYERTGSPALLDRAVSALHDAVAAAPPGYPDLAETQANLGIMLLRRFDRAGDAADLDAAIDAGRRAADAALPGDPDFAGYVSNLGFALSRRFDLAGDAVDLDAAVDALRWAADAAAPGDPGFAGYLSNLGVALRRRFDLAGGAVDLDAAVDVGRRAVDAAAPGDPGRAMYPSNLGHALLDRSQRAKDAVDLDAAVDAWRRAVDAAAPGHPDLAAYLSDLGVALRTRFEWAGDAVDLNAAVDAWRRAVDAATPSDSDLPGHLSNLGIALRSRFDRTGNTADLDDAIDAGQRAVHAAPPGDPNLPMYLSNLGDALRGRFDRAGNTADLDDAIDAGQRAVDAAPPGHPGFAGYLSNLGIALRTRAEWAGDAADLDDAVDAGRRAVDAAPPGDPGFEYLSGLGVALRTRFEWAGDATDLDAAIDTARRTVDATPPGYPGFPRYLSNLADSLFRRAERARDAADLDAAIDTARRTVDATPPGQTGLASILSSLAGFLLRRAEWARNAADLDEAIDVGRRAVDAAAPGHPNLAAYLSNLAVALGTRAEWAGDAADLDAAIDTARRTVDATPSGHPDLAVYLSNLGSSLIRRAGRTGDAADLDAAIRCWRKASQVPAGTPLNRLDAAGNWGQAAAQAGLTHQAAEGYKAAVGLLAQVAWHGLDRVTREEHLAHRFGLAADAAACAVLDGRPELAVELLEQGRSVLWNQALNLRDDLSRLAEQAPDLARRLDSIRQVLDAPLPSAMSLPEPSSGNASAADRTRQQQDAVELRRRMARDWDDVLAQVKLLDGFKHFLAAVPYADLAAAATQGPVVIVNASQYGCHALIADAGRERVRVLTLRDLTLDAAIDRANGMLRVLADARRPGRSPQEREKDRRAILDVLDWLWEVIAGPVLVALGHTGPPGPGDPWPRVQWCPTGPLTVLPIHAAGHHPVLGAGGADHPDCVLERVISSYTPTVTALIRSQQMAGPAPVRQLTVGMPATAGLPPLPAVPYELDVIARHFPPGEANLQLAGPRATRADVLTAMDSHSWVHLACHAEQQHADPDRSGFALWDGTLTITDLAALPTRRRDLAFLSACQTALGSIRHLDEAIHLAAAMQFLGYRDVIATMWTITDSSAPHVADDFYTELTRDGRPDPARAADAIHQAIRALHRDDRTHNPLLWAPYIHLGN